jgi:hypothetical protein
MPDRSSWGGFVRRAARIAGRKFEAARTDSVLEEARESYEEGKATADALDLPRDDDGKARIVCRRHAEKRSVELDAESRPECYEADHPDCEGCVSDIRKDRVETW